MKRSTLIILVVCIISISLSAMPSIPGKTDKYSFTEYPSEKFGRNSSAHRDELPQNILGIMVQFSDISFNFVPDYPDSLAHNKEYFERLFFHLSAFYTDASHGNYLLTEDNYTVWDNIITLSQPMGYYGENEEGGSDRIDRKCEFVQEIVLQIDEQLDFNDYDAIIIIHAGAGEEADVHETNEDQLSSTFLSRRSLQAGIDPENNDFPGIETNDGIYLTEFVIIPETEWQPNGVQGEDIIYSIFGVIVHQFGHQIGLPTLFDNNPDNGKSYGIGGFGVMGTGVWNASGFVPPLPCAWSRYYLGWEVDNIVEINSSLEDLSVVFPMAEENVTPKLYKINISESEYFLIENRQQNPDGSVFINADGDTLATFTFETITGQSVYPPGHAYAGQPKFSFMDNSYEGCEWDFYLPGFGSGAALEYDGSGLLIWHIDENIITANFTPDFEVHSVNGDASHKGVDLEEANGIQYLDSNIYYESFYGSKDDSYRAGNNTYFGKNYYNDIFSTPIANSYYGGVPLEIYDISNSDSTMSFSVTYEWSLNANFLGDNPHSAAIIDFDDDGENEIFYPMPDSKMYLWKNDLNYPDFPLNLSIPSQVCNYFAFDPFTKSILVPTKNENSNTAYLFQIDNDLTNYQENLLLLLERSWAASPVVNTDETSVNRVFLPLHDINSNNSEIIFLNNAYQVIETLTTDHIATNLMYKNNKLYFIDDSWIVHQITLPGYEIDEFPLNIEANLLYPKILSALLVDINLDNSDDLIITAADSTLHVFDATGNLLTGFPQEIPLNSIAVPSISDIDNNGYPEILIGGENTFAIFDKNGNISQPSNVIPETDSMFVASGIIALNIDDDDEKEIIGNMSRNRFCIWDNVNFNEYELSRNYDLSFGSRSLNYPLISNYANAGIQAYIPSNNGTIYKTGITATQENIDAEIWQVEFANLQRTASNIAASEEPPVEGSKVFNKAQTYFYPNPLSTTFNKAINYNSYIPAETIILRIETFQDADVKIKIFDIAANKIYENTCSCEVGFNNKINIDASDLSSGIYFAILSAKGKVLKLKFAIEK
ncbi:MAG: T9SS type A sorting domain-containing protein [Candidatus Tenebribacter davisii]|nr:T9SS type A sorting domain-containing protein [Candidatus Tenebribacter davisii]